MHDFQDYYQVLYINRDADYREIKSAYRRLAFQYHPDRNPGNKEALESFKKITEAYGVLIDPVKRGEYDNYLQQADRLKGMGGTFTKYGYDEILRDIFKSDESRDIFEQMSKGGTLRMDEKSLRRLLTGGLLFGGIFFGFWCISPIGFRFNNDSVHFGDSHRGITETFNMLKERFKTGIANTVSQMKGFWDAIGGKPSLEDKRSPYYHLIINHEESQRGTTKGIEFNTNKGVKKYRVKIPPGIKNNADLRIRDKEGQTFYLHITISTPGSK